MAGVMSSGEPTHWPWENLVQISGKTSTCFLVTLYSFSPLPIFPSRRTLRLGYPSSFDKLCLSA